MTITNEYVVELANGRTIRTDTYADNLLSPQTNTIAGSSYVRVCEPNGYEVAYWTHDEWQEEPQLVMGAILGACETEEQS